MENAQIHKQFWNIVIIAEDLIEESKEIHKDAQQDKSSGFLYDQIVNNLADALIATSTLFDRDYLSRHEQRLLCTQPYPDNHIRKQLVGGHRQAKQFISDMHDVVLDLEKDFSPEQWEWKLDKFLISIVKTRLNYTLNEGFEIEEERE